MTQNDDAPEDAKPARPGLAARILLVVLVVLLVVQLVVQELVD